MKLPSLRLLVFVEDEKTFKIIVDALSAIYEVAAERVNSEAQFIATIGQGNVDIVICEYHLPGTTISALLSHVQETSQNIPLLLIIDHAPIGEISRLIKGGISDVILTSHLSRLPTAVEKELFYKELREENDHHFQVLRYMYAENRNLTQVLENSALISITDTKGIILTVNELFCQASHYNEEDLIGKNHRIVNSGYHSLDFWRVFWDTISTGNAWRGEICNRAKTGELYWVDSTVNPVYNEHGELHQYISIRYIITEKKEAEARLLESEQRFRRMADSSPGLIWLTDVNNHLVYANTTWLLFTGRILEEELATGWLENIHPNDFSGFLDVFSFATEHYNSFTTELRLRNKVNEFRWMLVTGTPLFLADGTFTGYIGSCVDISERVRAEQQIRVFNLELEQRVNERTQELVELNREKDEFLGIVAHDLKNPLAAISLITERMLMVFTNNETTDKIPYYTGEIQKTSKRMMDLITRLLDVNKIEAGAVHFAPEFLNIGSVIQNIIIHHQKSAEKKQVRIQSELLSDMEVFCDNNALEQIFDNLLSNAIKYSPPCKSVYITIEKVGDMIQSIIRDEGPGISSEDQKQLFKKYTRLSARPTGGEHSTGLGLSIVKKLTELQGGRVWCESEPGNGARFIVEFPRVS